MTGKRRKAREHALRILYQLEMRGEMKTPLRADSFAHIFGKTESDTRKFSLSLVEGVLDHLAFIDELVSRCAVNWKLERMSFLDRNILRLAAFEIWFLPEIPAAVSINEAIEIAKNYVAGDSPKFINGVLNRVKEEFEKQ